MAALTAAALAAALSWPPPANGTDPVDRWAVHVAEASVRFGVPSDWIRRVIRLESSGRTQLRGRPIVSPAGALGLMQLMPLTWLEMRARIGLGADPHDPRSNILAGTLYLRLMYDRFGYPGLFAAYNAGPARYGAYLAGRGNLPAETHVYLSAAAGSGRVGALSRIKTAAVQVTTGSAERGPAQVQRFRTEPMFVTLSRETMLGSSCRGGRAGGLPTIVASIRAGSCTSD